MIFLLRAWLWLCRSRFLSLLRSRAVFLLLRTGFDTLWRGRALLLLGLGMRAGTDQIGPVLLRLLWPNLARWRGLQHFRTMRLLLSGMLFQAIELRSSCDVLLLPRRKAGVCHATHRRLCRRGAERCCQRALQCYGLRPSVIYIEKLRAVLCRLLYVLRLYPERRQMWLTHGNHFGR